MKDYPDFQPMVWPRRDWATEAGELVSFMHVLGDVVQPGTQNDYYIYIVPPGKKFLFADGLLSAEFRTQISMGIEDGAGFLYSFLEPYSSVVRTATTPIVATSGQIIKIWAYNWDIVPGRPLFCLTGWQTPASKPEEPKNDSPEELYRCGEFNFSQIVYLPDNEQVFIFYKIKDKVRNYLRFKDYGRKNQKVLAQLKIKPEHAQEIMSNAASAPEKLKKV